MHFQHKAIDIFRGTLCKQLGRFLKKAGLVYYTSVISTVLPRITEYRGQTTFHKHFSWKMLSLSLSFSDIGMQKLWLKGPFWVWRKHQGLTNLLLRMCALMWGDSGTQDLLYCTLGNVCMCHACMHVWATTLLLPRRPKLGSFHFLFAKHIFSPHCLAKNTILYYLVKLKDNRRNRAGCWVGFTVYYDYNSEDWSLTKIMYDKSG